jgi:hypothetical protein
VEKVFQFVTNYALHFSDNDASSRMLNWKCSGKGGKGGGNWLKKERSRSTSKVVVSHTVEQEIRENYTDSSKTGHICLCRSYLSTHSAAFSGFQVIARFLAGKLFLIIFCWSSFYSTGISADWCWGFSSKFFRMIEDLVLKNFGMIWSWLQRNAQKW